MQLNTSLLNRLGAIALAMASFSSACSSDDSGGSGAGGGGAGGSGVMPAGEPTFAAIYSEILTKGSAGNCTFGACHGQPPNPNTGLFELSSTDKDATYAHLVGPVSMSTTCAGMPMVTPGQPEMSLLYTKLLPTPPCGVRMPFGGMLTEGQIEQIRLWIVNGAMNNGMVVAGAGGAGGAGGVAGMMTGGMGGMTGGAGGTTGGAGGMTGGAGGMTGGAGGMTGGMGGITGMGGEGGMMAGGTFTLTSSAFENNAMLPADYRCADESIFGAPGMSPPLAWTNPPAGTMSFAITLTDNSNDFAHWTIYDIPAATTMLAAGVPSGATTMPAGAKQSANNGLLAGGDPQYFGPCGTNTSPNPYEFKIFALDVATLPDVTSASDRAAMQTAIDAHDLGTASVIGMSAP